MQRDAMNRKRVWRSKAALWIVGFVTIAVLSFAPGCTETQRSDSGEAVAEEGTRSSVYDKADVAKSSSLDVLSMMKKRENELLYQSDSTVVSSGVSDDGYGSWFTMVAFDEHSMTAVRKYFFVVDENAKRGGLLGGMEKGIMFDSKLMLPASIADRSYAGENDRAKDLLQYALAAFKADLGDIGEDLTEGGPDARRLAVNGMLVRSSIEAVLQRIGQSEAVASQLGEGDGIEFEHMNFETGTAKLTTSDAIATLHVELGAPVPRI